MDDFAYYTREETPDKKRQFAAALMLHPLDPNRAACSIESRVTHISYILNNWQFDAEVNKYMYEIRDSQGVSATIPTKEQFAATLYTEGTSARHPDTKLDFYKLFAEVMGYVEKGKGATINNNLVQQRNVVILPAMQSGEDMEARLMEQQRLLING